VFFATYGFGQALTDCFQMDTDAISASYRPMVRGVIRRTHVAAVSMTGLLITAGIAAVMNAWTVPLAAACVLGLSTYTWFKRRWWAGPAYNAWIVVGLFGIAVLAADSGRTPFLLMSRSALLTTMVVFFAYADFVLAGYFKDISADASTGYQTLPVRFGRKASALMCHILGLLALAATSLELFGGARPAIAALGFAAAGASAGFIGHVRLHRNVNDETAHRAIAPVVHAYVLLLSAIAAHHQPQWLIPLLVQYAAFVAAMRLRPLTAQI
jgi:4-hydroxybenzoate polyprenyltransferase